MDEKFLDILKKIKDEYSITIFQNVQKVRALTSDLAPDMRKECYLLTSLLNSNGYNELKNADTATFLRLLKNLENDYCIKEAAAAWIINCLSAVVNGSTFSYDATNEEDVVRHVSVKEAVFCNIDGYSRVAVGNNHTVAIDKNGNLLAAGDNSFGQLEINGFADIVSVWASDNYTVGLRSDGKVMTAGDVLYGRDNVEKWDNIKSIAITSGGTIGLKHDGNIVFAGKGTENIRTENWKDIVSIAASESFIVGVKNTGKVIVNSGDINVTHWRDVVSVVAGSSHIVGLRSDGRVLAAGRNNFNQCNVSNFRNVTQIAIGRTDKPLIDMAKEKLTRLEKEVKKFFFNDYQISNQLERIAVINRKITQDYETIENASIAVLNELESEYARIVALLKVRDNSIASHMKEAFEALLEIASSPTQYDAVKGCHTVALKKDGTVCACGWNGYGQCSVDDFFNVKKIITGNAHTIGLRYDKTLHFAGVADYNQDFIDSWRDIDDVYAQSGDFIIGLSGNRLLNCGSNDFGQCDVDFWLL